MEWILQLLIQYKYAILFPLACFEGPFVALAAGFLVHTGYLNLMPTFFILLFGDLVPDTLYFYIGKSGHKIKYIEKYSSRFSLISSNTSLLKHLWDNHAKKMMFFGKLAYGLSIPFIISAGLVKMPYKKFMACTIPATLFQYSAIMAIGYSMGYSYTTSQSYIKDAYIVVALCLVLVLGVYIGVSKYAKRTIEAMEKSEGIENITN